MTFLAWKSRESGERNGCHFHDDHSATLTAQVMRSSRTEDGPRSEYLASVSFRDCCLRDPRTRKILAESAGRKLGEVAGGDELDRLLGEVEQRTRDWVEARPPPGGRKRKAGCGKLIYTSVRDARDSNAKARFRVRVYRCPDCGYHHVSNDDKKKGGGRHKRKPKGRREGKGKVRAPGKRRNPRTSGRNCAG